MNLIETFQNLVAQVPELVQPLIVALAGAIPFIEGEGAVSIGIIGGISPVIAAIAAIVGNFLCVLVVVLVSSGARQAVVNRSRAKTAALAGAGGGTIDEPAADAAETGRGTARREVPACVRALRRSRGQPARTAPAADAVHRDHARGFRHR